MGKRGDEWERLRGGERRRDIINKRRKKFKVADYSILLTWYSGNGKISEMEDRF